MDKKLLSCPHCGGMAEELQRLNRYKAYWDELYGQGLEVANWHQNGKTEPLDSFLDDAESELESDRNLYPIPAVEWVPVSERLPDSGGHVLLCCEIRPSGKRYICFGYLAEPNTIAIGPYSDAECTYSGEDDEYYLVEGWYEVIRNWDDFSSVPIADFVTHWAEMPKPPEGAD